MKTTRRVDKRSGYRVIYDCFFFFQAEDGIRDAQESRGLGDVYKRQYLDSLGRHQFPGVPHPLLYFIRG